MPDAEVKSRTPSETLINCLEDFGASEPINAIVIYTNQAGDVNWSISHPLGFTQTVGMLECVKQVFLQRFSSEENRS